MELVVAIGVLRGEQSRCTTQRGWDAFEAVLTAAGKELHREQLRAGDPS